MTRSDRLRRALGSRRIPLVAALLACALTASSLGTGLAGEDFLFRVATQRELTLETMNLYDAEDVAGGVALAQRIGTLPWITHPDFHISFWRPLASLTHWLDYRLLPGPAWRLHLESVLVYALAALAAALFYRRLFERAWVAGIAALLYAIDDAHGHAVGWLANRHAVLGAALGTLALWQHDRWRRGGARTNAIASLALLALALTASELAVAAVLWIVAHALTLDPAPARRRALAVVPALGIGVGWLVMMRQLGHGAIASGIYIDPLREPFAYLRAFPERAGTLLLGQLGAPPSDTWHVVPPTTRALLAVGGGLAAVLLALALAPRFRSPGPARFLALGGVLSLLPTAATFPSDRLLYFVGLGATGLVALVLGDWIDGRRSVALRLVAPPMLIVHALAAPVLLPVRTLRMAEYHRELELASSSAYASIRAPDERLVVVNSPDYYFCKMLREIRWTRSDPNAAPILCLAGTLAPIEIERVDPNALEVRPMFGFLDRPFNQTFRARTHPMRVGESVFVGTAQVVVSEVGADGSPAAAIFRFVYPLESDKLRFVRWHRGEYRPFSPPPIGEVMRLTP